MSAFDAFDPDDPGDSAGLNFEHIVSGHSNPENMFSPRHGIYTLSQEEKDGSILLRREKEDSRGHLQYDETHREITFLH